MKDIITKIKIFPEASIKEALKKIDEVGMATLFVCDKDGSLLGSLTDGDIRRQVLKTGNLQEKIGECFNPNPVFVFDGDYTMDTVKRVMLEKTVEVVPVVNADKRILDILFWTDIFEKEEILPKKIDVPVVIMAGGKGERLGPFTKIFPKSLIPVGDKPIIEIVIDKFRRYGVGYFYITLNYKGDMIKTYLDGTERDYTIKFVWEKEFLGTAGSLKLIGKLIGETLIVTNSDIIVDVDYGDLIAFHNEHKNILTVVGSIQHHKIPYGIVEFEDGRIKNIQEKPEFDITINTGVYVLSRESLDFIPKNKFFDMTDLIQIILDSKKRVGIYPVSEKSYIDVGEWEEYKKAIDKLQSLR